ncbi:polyphosphate:nucleotide phosphotransferase, PPK2 family [Pedobacter steynii]|uniref:Polyphosphate:nucleotide phosphotransferase, PPK2 family n=1 Tax=Pedobacter steynii TaxID=430522 RepID=A0A1G9KCH3_9SPHI|nr:polyphosphate kinase 2 family protein [Pedobacter steynii]NQX38510.1 polyphosphate kinase 2 family protein [Pedobacter steynii]SDL47302.1 polyphosphate:nucleotide phosphotransferase, PPK2 family [Pedobacter steynii]
MKKEIEKYLAVPGKKVLLKDYQTSYNGDQEKEDGKQELEEIKEKLSKLQETLYASNTHSVLILFQAMDAAGKDSAISHVMSGLNPQGCQVYSFKAPTSEEYEHDFLWRHYKALPERGRIGIHNRSHYENVLVCKVHPEYVLNENIPGYQDVRNIDDKFWKNRYESIRNFEKHISDNGTAIIKIFLNVSKDEQKSRFLDRINDPAKNWKFSSTDITERGRWKEYMEAYEMAIEETSTEQAPWYIIPADKKWHARLAISQILEEHFTRLDLKFPVLAEAEMKKLAEIKEALLQD